ncbi:histidine phosphatase family protein [Phytomonospora sp. NPDC050363]|uniref:histidine phosphatase family protein n=1 Tax=Phytomonospora sp. NPDC050363 TaxID=3155642 RepID=UPI00340354B4
MSRHTIIALIRHGETPWHRENRYCGRTDLPLTETGERQAAELAGWAAATPALSAVHSSTLTRAIRTAAPAADAAGLPHLTDDRLVELDFGAAEGLTAEEMSRRWPRAREAFVADPVANPLPGGEDPWDAIARGSAAVDDAARAHVGGVVLVVCHSTLLRLVACHLTGADPAEYRRLYPKVGNTSGAILRRPVDAAAEAWELLAFNPVLTREGFGAAW